MWAVQGMAGLAEADVARWARQMAAAWPTQRAAMTALTRGLASVGYDVWIVSASNRWIVEAAASSVGVDPRKVIAMAVEVEGGVLTDRPVTPYICRAGKVEAIHQRFGRRCDLAFGDSVGDLEMLEDCAQPFVIGRHDKPGVSLLPIARERGWPVHRF
jgi:HAD superfamily phosphoserine phosphatase-like hydrolase